MHRNRIRAIRYLVILLTAVMVLTIILLVAAAGSGHAQYLPMVTNNSAAGSNIQSETAAPFASATIPPLPTGALCPDWVYVTYTPGPPTYCATATPNPYP